uniref:Uncharacterized protein n=1 Tax=viral metagenome TaxID=1070528 RepID=A0A6C0IRD6_9ZZZZ
MCIGGLYFAFCGEYIDELDNFDIKTINEIDTPL